MKKLYYRKFKNKSIYDLEDISKNTTIYDPIAIDVALELIHKKKIEYKIQTESDDNAGMMLKEVKAFLSNYSWRELLSYCVSLTMILSIQTAVSFYQHEYSLSTTRTLFLLLISGIVINHILYFIRLYHG
ncbi:hypothetical protein EI427_16200 [Flammeovirga pectinis]|uniref:Uncharacterized protein n=1 Tax=Flammeovirga pectinis TaxID=2494373 RepID=A0A3Q9FNA9_9BACT|nr:hypothetical protein [Flammeovirga pectinis]AZQ63708.1 hypothetical protein EI427_16200 [Flammeovirga pectinis]